jgi:hypothetical protein
MKRIEKFKPLIEKLDNSHESDLFKYLGTGNPNADILIIGKEAALDPDSQQQKLEIESNFQQWKDIKRKDDFDQSKIPERGYYSPLYPYKRQVLRIDDGKNWGTSRTWYNYQKLYNLIYGKTGNTKIDFHEGVFITEANAGTSKKTKNADTSSLCFRKEHILKSDFILSFPVIIIAGVGYFEVSNTKNEVEKIFKVKFKEKCFANGNEKQPYWIHWNADRTRLLINTYQLSMAISDDLLEEVANVVRESGLIKI